MEQASTMIISALKNRSARTGDPPPSSWHGRLQDANQILHEMAATTEGEFIQLGEKLQDFYFRTKGLSDLSSQVAKCLSGDDMKQHTDGLQTVFDQVHEQDHLTEQGISVLSSLLNRFESMRGRLDRFDQTIRNLHVLCNFIKIESARLVTQETGFTTLGEEVRKLAGDITAKTSELGVHSHRLEDMIRQGLQRMMDFEKKQQGHARLILDQAVQNMTDMTRHHQSSSQTLGEIAVRWKRISQNIGEVVASMQFHDITRQRLEHVRDALRDVGDSIAAPAPAAPDAHAFHLRNLFQKRNDHPPQFLSKLGAAIVPCKVQTVQLRDADADMLSAVGRIIDNLKRIASEITIMAGEMKALASGGGGQKEETFLADLEKKLSSLSDALASYADMNREWAASMEVITTSARDMTVFIRDIDKIGIQMRLISLNASIHAAHLGQEGAALGILAESISRLSNDTTREIDAMSTSLKDIMNEAGAIDVQRSDPSGERLPVTVSQQTEPSGLSAQIQKMIAPLHQMDEHISDLLGRIDQDAETLTRNIETTIQGITVHKKISKEIHKVITELESMVENMYRICPGASEPVPSKDMADMAERYTMEREREIHHAIAGTAAAGAVAAVTAAGLGWTTPDNTPETAADDIELFDDFLFDDSPAPAETEPAKASETGLDDNIELFDDILFEDTPAPAETKTTETSETLLDDNIELFDDILFEDTPAPAETEQTKAENQAILTASESPAVPPAAAIRETEPKPEADEDLGDNVELF